MDGEDGELKVAATVLNDRGGLYPVDGTDENPSILRISYGQDSDRR